MQGLISKLTQLQLFIDINKPNIMILTETWFDDSHTNKEICIHGYNIIRKDRKSTPNRGGVCLYVEDSIIIEEIDIAKHSQNCTCENIWVKIRNAYKMTLIIGAI